jgi:valyl-tRNA synthetase
VSTADPVAPPPPLATAYDPAGVEAAVYQRWVDAGVFTPPEQPRGPAFSIVIPPPNVTGVLHIGHALGHTLMDALTRRRRMQGHDALWLPGTDHAGISTQTAVERQLASAGLSRQDLGRDAFVERTWAWREEYGGRILDQMRQLGDGVDWTRLRFTLDAGLSRAVRAVFVRMYHDGLVYRAERIINWCPRCLTALSDIEVESSEDEGELVEIDYGPLTVATTRVETMLGDTAVAVHPADPRYAHLVGTELELPLTGRRIPVVADEHVDPDFGTGAVKVTPAHDPNDFEIGRRHGLAMITVMDERGVITAGGPFAGLDRYEARPAITAALRELGLVRSERRPYLHAVPHCDRCQTVVEPRLSLQWFVRVEGLARAAGDMVRDGRVSLHPPEMAARFFGWVDDMHDWCISRQLWWGHRIPVWTCPHGHRTVTETDPDRCVECGSPDLSQDPDVLDTWFSSGLWPFSTLGWPDRTADLERFFPTDVLVTGYDIIFFWVVRMMMFSAYTMGREPFRAVAFTGLVRDAHGKKMSKSWGNVVDPLDWIERFGADATRFTFARGANPGVDVPVGEDWVRASRNFVNKVWNATRFALLNGADPARALPPPAELAAVDRWVLSRLDAVIEEVDRQFEAFEFAKVCDALFHFAWDEVFDWYLEAAKVALAAGGAPAEATRAVLGHVLDALLRLLHPVMPFVTEELWTRLTAGVGAPTGSGAPASIVTAAWPVTIPGRRDPAAEADMARLQQVVTELRAFRTQQRIEPRRRLEATVTGPVDTALVAALAGLNLVAGASGDVVEAAGVRVVLDLALDRAAERDRLARALTEAEAEVGRLGAKLGNDAFVQRAPAAVVAETRTRSEAAAAEVARLQRLLA